MENKLNRVFQKAKYEPAIDLPEVVWGAVVLRNKQVARLKLGIFALIGLVSLGGLVPAFTTLSNDLTQSGFSEYFSLIFKDSQLVLFYWRELSFSLAETLPVTSIVFTLSLIFVFFLSFRYIIKQVGQFTTFPKLSI